MQRTMRWLGTKNSLIHLLNIEYEIVRQNEEWEHIWSHRL